MLLSDLYIFHSQYFYHTPAFSEIGGSWLLIIGLATRFGALAIVGTISVAIYHALVTSGFNIFLLELLLLYFASATSIALTGPGNFSLDEVIIRILKSEDEEEIISSTKPKNSKEVEVKEETSKGGLFQFLQANILSDTSS
jgi:putative oxidoreductase